MGISAGQGKQYIRRYAYSAAIGGYIYRYGDGGGIAGVDAGYTFDGTGLNNVYPGRDYCGGVNPYGCWIYARRRTKSTKREKGKTAENKEGKKGKGREEKITDFPLLNFIHIA